MTVVLEKVCVIPTIESVCATYQGNIYTVAMPGYISGMMKRDLIGVLTALKGKCCQKGLMAP